MARALFLFNHDAAHQVAHLAPIAAATAREHPDIESTVAYATPDIRTRIEQLIDPEDARRIVWTELKLGMISGRLCRALDRIIPASRLARLRIYEQLFRNSDAVISTERTCLRVQKRLGPNAAPLFIRVPHGTGDRSVTFHPDHRRFDLSLVAGAKMAEQLVANGVHAERIRVTGYSKFERIDLSAKPDFFGNGRPAFVYNPHFDPHLSSWYDAGPELLEFFASPAGQEFNLIFAPHVMLFRKATHVSPEYKVARRRPDVPEAARSAENILIDTDGPKLFDMSYMLSADGYIGDASSQIYEFLARPRPAFLLDPNDALTGQGERDLPFLGTGPVARTPAELVGFLERWNEIGDQYRARQQQIIDHTFSLTDTPPSVRAANAIADAIRHRTS
ncbi:hypothetical protein GRI69_10085 [Erythrobacter vulgaris]|uniref:Glycerophosphotransferase n=1 Tax=Qipengyuania vulgaris TaxID=291985 RepID=A0A844XTP9_9SPHN|nr:hypothetical protein [Qipengyuania vulgaris]MXO48607.1 hypothetical protein [Qipengyuania vulgaris]